MNLSELNKNHNQEVVDTILKTVAKEFRGEPAEIWLSGISANDAYEAARQLRSYRGNQDWSFSVKEHGASGSTLVINRFRLAQLGDYGDK
jgi:hypothetical protein